MSRENVEVVRRWVEFYNQRDTDGLIGLTAPDYEMKSLFAGIESGGIFRAYTGFPFAYFKEIDEAYEQFELVATEWIDAVFWLRAGKVFHEESYTLREDALEAVGLRE